MKRREFVERAGKAAVGLSVLSASGLAACREAEEQPRQDKNWVWVHGGRERSAPEWRAAFARVREVGISGVLVGGGDTAVLSEAARDAGLEFHRWTWILNRSGDDWAKENHPEWYTVSRNGASTLDEPPYVGYYQWLCPTREPVREYLSGAVAGIAADPRVDGVHIDYIRHSDVILPVGLWEKYDLIQDQEYPEFDYCYCEVCRESFGRQTGKDPLELQDPAGDPEWREFRWNSVTGLVRDLAESVHSHGKPITAAVFPTPALARRLVRQDWDRWPLDAFFPMIYHEFYEEDVSWVASATAAGVTALPKDTPLYSGLYLPSLSPTELGEAVRLARGAGAVGVSLFEMSGLSDEHLAALKVALGA